MKLRATIFFLLIFVSLGELPLQAGIDRGEDDEMKSFILDQAQKKLAQRLANGEVRFEIQPRWIPDQLLRQSPAQITDIQILGQLRRYTNFEVTYSHRGNRQRVEVQLKVKVEQKLPVVVGRVRKGSKLKADDLAMQWVSILKNRAAYYADTKELIGKTLRQTLLSGQPIRKSYVSRDLIIKAGDEVQVFVKRNGVQVQVSGEAREDGAKGDRITIFCNKTNRKYVGEVIRPGVILWKNTL
ncbi:flagellar basal body P-ring formation chaperone FlgA [Fodinibius salsisoli]|uniref:Flagella basal body P-ring formation protein FlgA n=1 Tax=Fodinibius salsisoli TaxID=2820877 RepID=A0ABT3PHG3_9BACT|nr:flagellar basal body P-ring formation chaperone FlgA [Fodinibius salsisoli]MCW9705356.1 flagellar basal body P-ring formation protein FlgA [Fodinibius salsisoli]